MLPNCALFLLVCGRYILSHMPTDCMVTEESVGWPGEVSMGFDFKFIIYYDNYIYRQCVSSQVTGPRHLDTENFGQQLIVTARTWASHYF